MVFLQHLKFHPLPDEAVNAFAVKIETITAARYYFVWVNRQWKSVSCNI